MGPARRRKKRRSRPNRIKTLGQNFTKRPLAEVLTVYTVCAGYKLASFFKCVPFEVIKGPGLRVHLFSSIWKSGFWYFSNAIVYFAAMFQAISFPRVIIQQGLTPESAIHVLYITIYSVGFLFFSSMLADESTFVGCVNCIDVLVQTTKGEPWGKTKWYSSPFGTIAIIYLAVIGVFFYLLIWACFLLMPTHSRYLSSLLPTHMQDNLFLMLLSGLFESTIWLWVGSLVFVVFCYWTMTTFQKIFWLEEMNMELDNCGCSAERWRHLFGFYRALKCLNMNHNNLSRFFLAKYYVNMVSIAVLYLYLTLKAFHLVPIYVYLIFPLSSAFLIMLIGVFTSYTAKWEQKSGDFIAVSVAKLRILRVRGEEYEALYKEARALQPLKSEIGFFDTTTIETPRALIGLVIDQLLLLLTL